MTLRLNKDHRSSLKALADQIIRADHALTDSHTTTFNGILDLSKSIVLADTPDSDIKVLRKYNGTHKLRNASFVFTDSTDVFNVSFNKARARKAYGKSDEYTDTEIEAYYPEVPNLGHQGWSSRKVYQSSEKLTKMYRAYDLADTKYDNELREKLSKYFNLIDHCTTFESLLSVWPEAEKLSATFYVNLPSVITDDVINSIKSESLARMEKAAALAAPTKKAKK